MKNKTIFVACDTSNLNQIKKIDIYTSHHTHNVIGSGANDPQKMDPKASRETLDHSIMYIFAVALEDGTWHHVKSYTKARAKRKSTIKIWKSIKTHESQEQILTMMKECSFVDTSYKNLFKGVVAID